MGPVYFLSERYSFHPLGIHCIHAEYVVQTTRCQEFIAALDSDYIDH